MTESKVVEAVGISANTLAPDKSLAKRVEEAMSKAVAKAQAEGVTDPNVIRARMMEAREVVLRPPKNDDE